MNRQDHDQGGCRHWIILGEREGGDRFRPSDWVDRLAVLGARFGTDRRLRYQRDLDTVVVNGQRALRVSDCLARRDADLYRMILDFAQENRLRMIPEVISAPAA